MAGLFDTLGNSSRSLGVVQRSIATTGHNIANVNTPGYSKQRNVSAPGNPEANAAGNLGTGVRSVTVDRAFDQFTQERLYGETSRLSALETTRNAFRDIESVVNDQRDGGLGTQLSGFFDAIDALANSGTPGQPLERAQVVSGATSLIETVQRYDRELRDIQAGADRGVTGTLADINALSSEIALLNAEIQKAEVLAPANDLRDRRDQLVVEISEKVGVSTIEDNGGMVSLRLASGYALVNGTESRDLVAVVDPSNVNPFDPTFSQIFLQTSATLVNVNSVIGSGELGGHLEVRDTVTAGAIRDLDAFVATLAINFNATHRTGLGLVDGAPHDFFVDFSANASIDNAARDFALAADVDPAQGGDFANIAAASLADPAGSGEGAAGDTTLAEQLGDLREGQVTAYLAGDPGAAASGASISLVNQFIGYVGEIGRSAASTARALEQQEVIVTTVQNRRDEASGVNIDEEVADLIQLQASFQANARVMSTVSQLLEDLLGAF